MKARLLLAAAAIVVTSNAFVLVHASRNRSGALDAEIELTERELTIVRGSAEDSAVALSLLWQNSAPHYDYRREGKAGTSDWFQIEKLRELGFDVSVAPESHPAAEFYRRMRAREVFAALEFDGPAWERWIQEHSAVEGERTHSRLVAIDAARSGEELRSRYPDRKRVLILRGAAHPVLMMDGRKQGTWRGVLSNISPHAIHVPPELLPRVLQYTTPYRATLRVGSKFEPWLADFRKVDWP